MPFDHGGKKAPAAGVEPALRDYQSRAGAGGAGGKAATTS
jgi:hypothetical protein